MFVIKWTNRMSREEGYVEKINKKEGYFENTFDKLAAKQYKTEGSAKTAVKWLESSKEGEQNSFCFVEAPSV